MVDKQKTELKILVEVLEHESSLDDETIAAFSEWRVALEKGKIRALTPKRRQWLMGVAERLELTDPEPANLFSSLSPERQAEQRARAAAVKLPWEK